jgi:hypothetical protein
LFQIAGIDEERMKVTKPAGKPIAKPVKQVKPIKSKEAPLTEAEVSFLSKLKRRIFFVSATLTREFKGTKYFIKKARTEEEWKEKREERKEKRK